MKTSSFILLLLVSSMATQAQTMPEVEQQIKTYLDAISYWRFEYSEEDTSFGYEVAKTDSIVFYNEILRKYIVNTSLEQPLMVKQAMKGLDDSDMKIATSGDKLFRIFSWNTHMAKQGQHFWSAAVYKNGNTKSSTTLNAAPPKKHGGSFEEVLLITGKNNKKYYLAIYKTIVSEKDIIKGIVAYEVIDGVIKAADLFMNNSTATSGLEYSYDYMSNYDFEKMKEVNSIHLSKNGKKLFIPDVVDNEMTGQWQIYNFDGSKFVYDKTGK